MDFPTKNEFCHFFIVFILATLSFFSCGKEGDGDKSKDLNDLPGVQERPLLPKTLSSIKAILVDKNATDETACLFYNLKVLAKTKIMFGHQDDTYQGLDNVGSPWSETDLGRSDVKDVTGSYPAVYGWDMIFIASFQRNDWFDKQAVEIRKLTKDAYNRGGINTYSWHYWNPVLSKKGGQEGLTEGFNASFYYDEAPVSTVKQILPNGAYHQVFNQSLDVVATYLKSLVDDRGKPIPIIFRPFHEMDGNWFWWGASHCTVQEYKDLFRYTVNYLKYTKQVHNVLFAWSPDRTAETEEAYLSNYPGDDYVDVLGMDNYSDLKNSGGITLASDKLKVMSDYAIRHNKVAALTETGLQNISQNNWFSKVLLPALTMQKVEISYAMVWSNSVDGYWTPYKNHQAAPDFLNFKNSPPMVFGDLLPDMYSIK